jgi:hypothetical protein
LIQGFEFSDAGRTYTCTVEERKGAGESWWWFAVSGDGQRYAPFVATKGDTRSSVQERVVAFYLNRLFQLTQPTRRGSHWGKRPDPKPAAAPQAELPPS